MSILSCSTGAFSATHIELASSVIVAECSKPAVDLGFLEIFLGIRPLFQFWWHLGKVLDAQAEKGFRQE